MSQTPGLVPLSNKLKMSKLISKSTLFTLTEYRDFFQSIQNCIVSMLLVWSKIANFDYT